MEPELGSKLSPLMKMILCNNQSLAIQMIENDQYLQTNTELGVTPLMVACYKGLTEVVDLLIKKGADVSVCDELDRNAVAFTILGFH